MMGSPKEIQANLEKFGPDELKANLEKAYSDHQAVIKDAIATQQAAKIETSSMGLALIAMGLFAFGDSDKSNDILDAVEFLSKDKRLYKVYSLLANSIIAMLPLPPDIRPKENVSAVRNWLEENQEQLQWDEALGVYIWLSQ
jgi:hypothetical protein